MVLAMLEELKPPPEIFKTICAEHGVTAATVRADMKWAGEIVNKDLDAAAPAEPVRIYWYLDRLAEFCGQAGAATPVMYNGQPLMGQDPETGELFPVLEADAPLLSVALKARQAQVSILGFRDSVKWKRSLAHQQLELSKAKVELAKEQLQMVKRDREIDEERKALLASRTQAGGILLLQRPDQVLFDRMARFLTLQRTELEEWVSRHTRQRGEVDGTDDAQDDVPGGDLQRPGESARLVGPRAPGGERDGDGGNGSGNGSGGDD